LDLNISGRPGWCGGRWLAAAGGLGERVRQRGMDREAASRLDQLLRQQVRGPPHHPADAQGVSPYLWPEMLIEAARSTRKSHTSSGCRKVMDAVVVIAAIQAGYFSLGAGRSIGIESMVGSRRFESWRLVPSSAHPTGTPAASQNQTLCPLLALTVSGAARLERAIRCAVSHPACARHILPARGHGSGPRAAGGRRALS
jgi:hypothetical protein